MGARFSVEGVKRSSTRASSETSIDDRN
ncbi:hypothetical protein CCACVL1_21309 [Corchorus capsularis]|uniref:Uncharacterized protein n=1 Tax=Corchorus capsularis TaxID=210143 RepID=A0A1R3H6T3_COCAP|nr:hypothetical protein CCACVL1_21309 [Corchorus capsularis]